MHCPAWAVSSVDLGSISGSADWRVTLAGLYSLPEAYLYICKVGVMTILIYVVDM